jgi:ABC-type nitrate/sulfonate/bicarbonate transport system ATPase subunit
MSETPCRGDCVCFRDVHRRFVTDARGAIHALRGVTLTCSSGELTCVLGPSGCGKTTLLRLAAGLDRPDEGTVSVAGHNVGQSDAAMVSQEGDLLPWDRAWENVALGPQLRGEPKRVRRAVALRAIRRMGMDRSVMNAYPHELSGGMRRRIAIARALCNHPRVLLMDEPFNGLDEPTRHRLQDRIVDLWRSDHRTILFVTHSSEEAVYLADRIVVMSSGSLVADVRNDLPRPRDRASDEFVRQVLDVRRHVADGGENGDGLSI